MLDCDKELEIRKRHSMPKQPSICPDINLSDELGHDKKKKGNNNLAEFTEQ
jgi:hypothetical protein